MTVEPTEARGAFERSWSPRGHDLCTLAAGAVAILLSRLVEPSGPQAPLTLAGRVLPGVCLVRQVTGRTCPSCGLSRGVIYLLRLDYSNSARANPLAPLAVVLGLWKVGGASRRCWLHMRRPLTERVGPIARDS